MRLQHIRQEDNLGCQIACAAMIAGCSYQEARNAIWPNWRGTCPPDGLDVQRFLLARGFEVESRYEHFYPARFHEEGATFDWPPTPFADVHLVSVRTLGINDYRHMVVMLKDGTVLDPDKNHPCQLSDYSHVEQISSIKRQRAAKG